MGTIRQYRPSFFSGFENATAEYKTLEELMDIPFVKNFRLDPRHKEEVTDKKFDRYAISDYGETREGESVVLVAEYKDGQHWVVGFCDRNEIILGLPAWKSMREKKIKV